MDIDWQAEVDKLKGTKWENWTPEKRKRLGDPALMSELIGELATQLSYAVADGEGKLSDIELAKKKAALAHVERYLTQYD